MCKAELTLTATSYDENKVLAAVVHQKSHKSQEAVVAERFVTEMVGVLLTMKYDMPQQSQITEISAVSKVAESFVRKVVATAASKVGQAKITTPPPPPSIFSPTMNVETQNKSQTAINPSEYKPRQMFTFSDRDIRRSYTKQLDKVFAKHCPSKRTQAPKMIARYPGREEELLRKTKAMFEKRSSTQKMATPGSFIARMSQCISTAFIAQARP